MKLNEEIVSKFESAVYYAKEAARLASEARLQQLDLAVVSSIGVGKQSISFYLDTTSDREAQQQFVHAVAQVFGCKEMTKTPNWCKSALLVSGETEDGKQLEISGYVPPTCQLVETEEAVSNYEIKEAEKILATRTRTVKKVVCA